ncbi:hypothetical protein NUBL17198_50560 [Klebsiella pneumoniae]|nr:hypothetical protein NUBL17198_50560 [Klebsiella pneumoniae]
MRQLAAVCIAACVVELIISRRAKSDDDDGFGGGAKKGNCAHAIERDLARPFWGAAPPHTVTSKDILRLYRKIPRD